MNHPQLSPGARIALRLFRLFCHPSYREELEGDLLEQYGNDAECQGKAGAAWRLGRNVLLLLRPEIIFYQPFNTLHFIMKTENWLKLLAFNALAAGLILLPFLPGTFNIITGFVSGMGRFAIIFGLISLPLGLIWLVAEHRSVPGKKALIRYRFALAALALSVIAYVLMSGIAWSVSGPAIIVVSAALLAAMLWLLIPAIRQMRRRSDPGFHPAPLYLISVPVVALVSMLYLQEPFIVSSRNQVIRQGMSLVNAIERYREQSGQYPEALPALVPAYLSHVPAPAVMGVDSFGYEKNGADFRLFFCQHLGESEEMVVYNKQNRFGVKGYYATGAAAEANWHFFRLD